MKDIPGYEGLYAATEDGKIWSYPKVHHPHKGIWLKQDLVVDSDYNKPYKRYQVRLYNNSDYKVYRVHYLIALTFIPNYEHKPQINHKDGNSLNNHVDNLEWVTAHENMQHAVKLGLVTNRSKKQIEAWKRIGAWAAKTQRLFTFSEAECIRAIYKITKKSYSKIAKHYKCSPAAIWNICNFKSYLMDIS